MSLQSHIQRRDNPHGLTLAKLGLDNLQPYPLATREEILALVRDDRYIDATASEWIKDAFTQYLIDLGLADEEGNLLRRDFSSQLYAHITEQDQLLISGTAMGGRRATYVIYEDGTEYITGEFHFEDHYYELVSGTFHESSVYTVELTIFDDSDAVYGDAQATVYDTRTNDDGYLSQDPEGFLYYDQRYFAQWENITDFIDLDAGLISEQ